jgi:hypothetical protein
VVPPSATKERAVFALERFGFTLKRLRGAGVEAVAFHPPPERDCADVEGFSRPPAVPSEAFERAPDCLPLVLSQVEAVV